MSISVVVKNGIIYEYVNGSQRKTYGSNIKVANTDGKLVAAIHNRGYIQDFVNGLNIRSYGSTNANYVSIQVTGGEVYVQRADGRTDIFVNGGFKKGFY